MLNGPGLRCATSNGKLLLVARPSTGIATTVRRRHGWARDDNDYGYFEDASTAVPGTAVKYRGLAFTPDGALYVTNSAPAATAITIDGYAIRADGALHVTTANASADVTRKGVGRIGNRAQADFLTPLASLGVTKLWDAVSGISQADATERVSAWADAIAGTSLAQGTAANQPILLPHSGTNYCWNAAVAGNTLSTPTVSITGNWTLTFDRAEADYTPASDRVWADKSSGNNGFKVSLLTTGVIRVTIGDGAAQTNFDSSVANGQTDFSRHTFQIVYVDNSSVKFYVDGVQLGTTVTVNKTLADAATAFLLGPWDGKLYSYSLTNGVATTYYGKTLSTLSEGSANFTDDTGATVTFNSTGAKPAQIVGSQQLLFDGAAHYLGLAQAFAQPLTFVFCGQQVTWTANDPIISSTAGNPSFAQNSGSPRVVLYAGSVGPVLATEWALRTNAVIGGIYNGASSVLQFNMNAQQTGNVGATNFSDFSLGFYTGAFGNFQCKSLALCNSALSTAVLGQVITGLNLHSAVF